MDLYFFTSILRNADEELVLSLSEAISSCWATPLTSAWVPMGVDRVGHSFSEVMFTFENIIVPGLLMFSVPGL